MMRSALKTKAAPRAKPTATGRKANAPYFWDASAISITGASREHESAASITCTHTHIISHTHITEHITCTHTHRSHHTLSLTHTHRHTHTPRPTLHITHTHTHTRTHSQTRASHQTHIHTHTHTLTDQSFTSDTHTHTHTLTPACGLMRANPPKKGTENKTN